MRTGVVVGLLSLTLLLGGCGSADEAPTPAPSAGDWRRLPDPPLSPRSHAVAVGVDDHMVVVGGWDFLCPPTADCPVPSTSLLTDGAVYASAQDVWRPMAPPPFGLRRGERDVVALGGSAFFLTGCASGPACGAPKRLLEYDVAADRWIDHGRAPGMTPSHAALVTAGDALVVHSGSDEGGETADFLFTPTSKVWEQLPDDPLPEVFDRSIVAVDGSLVLAGSSIAGLDAGRETGKLAARLDLATMQWARLPDAPGQGYQLFPTDSGPLLNGHFIDAPGWLLDAKTWTWAALPPQTERQHDLRGVFDSDRASYDVSSSPGQESVHHQLFVFDSVDGGFVRVPPLTAHEDVHDDTSAALGRDLFVYGGQRWRGSISEDGELVGDAWIWTPPTS